jgi:hypothetical protein
MPLYARTEIGLRQHEVDPLAKERNETARTEALLKLFQSLVGPAELELAQARAALDQVKAT